MTEQVWERRGTVTSGGYYLRYSSPFLSSSFFSISLDTPGEFPSFVIPGEPPLSSFRASVARPGIHTMRKLSAFKFQWKSPGDAAVSV